MNSGVPKLQYSTRVFITNDKQARELHELAQYLRKIPINSLGDRTHNTIKAAVQLGKWLE